MRAFLALLLTDLIVALGDLALMVMWVKGEVASIAAIGMHTALALTLVGLAAVANRGLTAALVCRAFTLLLLGPLGGFTVAMQRSAQLLRRDKRFDLTEMADTLLEARQGASTEAETIFAQVRQGRRLQPASSRPEAFALTFANGDMLSQQAAIAAISRRYHPNMLPALMAALRADIPAIRVQAAAVYAKLRENYDARAKMLLARQPSREGDEALAAFERDCREVARSGFLDRTTVELLEAAAEASSPERRRRPSAEGRRDERTATGSSGQANQARPKGPGGEPHSLPKGRTMLRRRQSSGAAA